MLPNHYIHTPPISHFLRLNGSDFSRAAEHMGLDSTSIWSLGRAIRFVAELIRQNFTLCALAGLSA